jgi:hypothetical protein
MMLEQIVQEIRGLSIDQRKALIMVIVDTLAEPELTSEKHSLLELEGLGKELWEGIDAQDYVNQLRNEWDQHP